MGLKFLNSELQVLCVINCKKINKCIGNQQCNKHLHFPGQHYSFHRFSRLFHTYDHFQGLSQNSRSFHTFPTDPLYTGFCDCVEGRCELKFWRRHTGRLCSIWFENTTDDLTSFDMRQKMQLRVNLSRGCFKCVTRCWDGSDIKLTIKRSWVQIPGCFTLRLWTSCSHMCLCNKVYNSTLAKRRQCRTNYSPAVILVVYHRLGSMGSTA